MKKRILFVCGSLNQTRQMHQVARQMAETENHFAPYYCDGLLERLRMLGLLEFTILGSKLRHRTLDYLTSHHLPLDLDGSRNDYDLVVTCSDLVIPQNIWWKKILLVQEGMTDPENLWYRLVRAFRFLPRWLASTAATGLSDRYTRFCVASEGYRDLFVRKGVRPEKIVVTGIPNFDNCVQYLNNDFPYRGYVLVCTSDTRETYKYENRKKFIRKALAIAGGRQLIFKLHPNENVGRAEREILALAPDALVFATGSAEEMIANCDVLITRYSTTVYVGLALGKECYSEFDVDELRRMLPLQNGKAAGNIAQVCRELLESPDLPVGSGKVRLRESFVRRKRSVLVDQGAA